MSDRPRSQEQRLPPTPWGQLPPQMRILLIVGSARTGECLASAFAADSAAEVHLEQAIGIADGLVKLRDELYDAVLVGHDEQDLDSLEFLDAIRTGSSEEQPILVLGNLDEEELAAQCYEAGGDDYICIHSTTTRTLIWKVARAMERHRLLAENRRYSQEHQHRLQREQEEALRLLHQQQELVASIEERDQSADDDATNELPQELVEHYHELLRTHVIMGSGNLSDELHRIADWLVASNVQATQAMDLHLQVLNDTLCGLGSRSSRHVMSRANNMILELTAHLVEGYRKRDKSAAAYVGG